MAYNRNRNRNPNPNRRNRRNRREILQRNQEWFRNNSMNNTPNTWDPGDISQIKIGDNFINDKGQRFIYYDTIASDNRHIFKDMHGQYSSSTGIPNGFLRTDNIYTVDMLNKYSSATTNINNSYKTYQQVMLEATNPNTPQHIVDSIYDSEWKLFNEHIQDYKSILNEIQAVDPNFTPIDEVQDAYNNLTQELNSFEEKKRQHFKPYADEYDEYIQQQIQNNTQLNSEQKNWQNQVDEEFNRRSTKKQFSSTTKVTGEAVDYHQDISAKIIAQEVDEKKAAAQKQIELEEEREKRRQKRQEAIAKRQEVEEAFSQENWDAYQQDYNHRYHTDDEGYLKEYDEHIQQKIAEEKQRILEEKQFQKELDKEVKKNSKKYKSKNKQGQVIGEQVDYHKDLSQKIIEEEKARKHQQQIDNDIKEHERQNRRETRQDYIQAKNEYRESFEIADYDEAVAINERYDETLRLFNESDHAEALQMNKHFDEHTEALKMNEIHDYIQNHTVDSDIDDAIRKAIKASKEDTVEGAQSALNKLARTKDINPDILEEAKKTLTEKYDDIYKDIQEQRASLKKTKNKKITNGKDKYRITTDGNKTTATSIQKIAKDKAVQESAEQASANLKKSAFRNLGHVANAGFAIMDFKDAKEAGKSTPGALLHAGAEFAKGELLGGWYMAAMLAKAAPTIAVSAVEGLNTMSRSMNSVQRRQLFGDAQFMDTQQLATMRQSGMELAKMSQYNLQQTLMGSEAEYLHRL